jgi:NAD(P)-dependent dehydrogenase (short-subunit alcohol dehydrogenase family)
MRQTQDSPLETPIDGLRATAAAPLPFAQNLRARSFLLEQQSSQADILPQLPGDGKKVSMICDVSKPEQVRALGAKVIEQFGRGAIYVNNAATLPTSTLETVTLDLSRRACGPAAK